MSWPSFYGYKYTPIGLRQREVKDEQGSKTYSTTVHLPEGGHLLDIERRFNPDGSVSKREDYNNFAPKRVNPLFDEDMRGRSPFSHLDRQADDIIANFRARQGTGIENVGMSCQSMAAAAEQETARHSISSTSRKMVSHESSSKEASLLASSRNMRREAKRLTDVGF